MTDLFKLRPTLYNPFDTCRECGKQTRVWLVEHFREERYCHACLGINWGTVPEARMIAEMGQRRQRHEVMRWLDEVWRPEHISKEGTRTPLDPGGNLECGCIPGHRSNHITHRCEVCGFADSDLEDGKPIPPCIPLQPVANNPLDV